MKVLKANDKVYFLFEHGIKYNLQLRWMFLFSLLSFMHKLKPFSSKLWVQIPSGVTIKAKVNLSPKGTADYL